MSDQEWQPRHSENDKPQLPPDPPTVRRYHVVKPVFSRHYDINTDDGEKLFHVESPNFLANKPGLIFHHGSSTKSPIVGVCYLPKAGREHKFGLGDPNQPRGMTWEVMNRMDTWGQEYHWMTDLLEPSQDKLGTKPRLLSWKRTPAIKREGQTKSTIWKHIELQDEETGELLASFVANPDLKIRGALEMKVDAGRSFDLMVLMTRFAMGERGT